MFLSSAIVTLNELSQLNPAKLALTSAAAGLNAVLWIVLVSFPFIQVSKRSAGSGSLVKCALNIRNSK